MSKHRIKGNDFTVRTIRFAQTYNCTTVGQCLKVLSLLTDAQLQRTHFIRRRLLEEFNEFLTSKQLEKC
jgi:hypothetical protein